MAGSDKKKGVVSKIVNLQCKLAYTAVFETFYSILTELTWDIKGCTFKHFISTKFPYFIIVFIFPDFDCS
jgi:hypothetical protein